MCTEFHENASDGCQDNSPGGAEEKFRITEVVGIHFIDNLVAIHPVDKGRP